MKKIFNKTWHFCKVSYIYNKNNKTANEKFTYHIFKRVGDSWGYFLYGDGVIDYYIKFWIPSPKEVGFFVLWRIGKKLKKDLADSFLLHIFVKQTKKERYERNWESRKS